MTRIVLCFAPVKPPGLRESKHIHRDAGLPASDQGIENSAPEDGIPVHYEISTTQLVTEVHLPISRYR